MACKFSILICSLIERQSLLDNLMDAFNKQLPDPINIEQEKKSIYGYDYEIKKCDYGEVEIIICTDSKELSTGTKRNILLDLSSGEYLASFDDDDLPSDCYIEEIMKGVNSGLDCCSLVGQLITDYEHPKIFRHSIIYEKYEEINGEFVRFPNHLNCIKSSIAKQFRFPEINHGEDFDWATQIHNSELLKTEYKIEKIIYYYLYKNKK